jgi:hypothetical protein
MKPPGQGTFHKLNMKPPGQVTFHKLNMKVWRVLVPAIDDEAASDAVHDDWSARPPVTGSYGRGTSRCERIWHFWKRESAVRYAPRLAWPSQGPLQRPAHRGWRGRG